MRATFVVTCLVVLAAVFWMGCSGEGDQAMNPVAPEARDLPVAPELTDLYLGPIDGLTSGWHRAPKEIIVPLGTTVQLRYDISADARVRWVGAVESQRTASASYATCPMEPGGTRNVILNVTTVQEGQIERAAQAVRITTADVRVEDIVSSSPRIGRTHYDLNEHLSNEETMRFFFDGSVASVREIGPGRYRTSVDREMRLGVTVDPPEFAALTEWRVDGKAVGLGDVWKQKFAGVGVHEISVGPTARSNEVTVETYAVSITSDHRRPFPDGEPVTFTATTRPAGYEEEVTWLSSTKYGSATPVSGTGSTFTVRFEDTWTLRADGKYWQWLGVRADNAVANQDQVGPPACPAIPAAQAVYTPIIPPDYYDWSFVPVGSNMSFSGVVGLQVQPPSHPENPYQYGTDAQFSVYQCEADQFTARFDAEGIFHTIVDDGNQISITTVFVGVPIEGIKKKKGKSGCTETFTVSNADLVISDKKNSHAERWDYYVCDLGQNMVEVADVADAVAQIMTYVNQNGKLNKLTIACHAANGLISIGGGSEPDNDELIGKDASNNKLGDYEALVAGLAGKFNANAQICLVGCNVGEGTEGQNLVDCLASDLGNGITVKAKKGTVCYPLRWYLLDRYASSTGEKGWAEATAP